MPSPRMYERGKQIGSVLQARINRNMSGRRISEPKVEVVEMIGEIGEGREYMQRKMDTHRKRVRESNNMSECSDIFYAIYI